MSIFHKNQYWWGLLLGLLTPIIGYLLIMGVSYVMHAFDADLGNALSSRSRTLLIVAVCTNIFWIRKYNQAFTIQTLRGVVSATMIYCALWFFHYYDTLYALGI